MQKASRDTAPCREPKRNRSSEAHTTLTQPVVAQPSRHDKLGADEMATLRKTAART